MAATIDRVRFVVDENLLRLGRAITALRRDVACFGQDPVADLLPAGMLDDAWIPVVGERGWVVITNDKRLRTRPAQAELAIQHGLKVIHLYNSGHLTAWDQAVQLLARWQSIEEKTAVDRSGPYWLSVRKTRVRNLNFQPGAVER